MAQVSNTSRWQMIKNQAEMTGWQISFFFVGRWTNRSCLWCDSHRRRWSVNLAWTQCCRASARPPPAPAPTAPRPPWSPRSAWHSGRAGCNTTQIRSHSWILYSKGGHRVAQCITSVVVTIVKLENEATHSKKGRAAPIDKADRSQSPLTLNSREQSLWTEVFFFRGNPG